MSDRQLAPTPAREPAPAPFTQEALTVQQVLGQVALIQQVMAMAMKDKEHYGTIPGCGNKPTLLKPGAEKLCMMFRLAPQYAVDERMLPNDHREYRVTVTLLSIGSQTNVGQGVGSCSTMETKYRYRGNAAEATDRPVPRAYWDLRAEDPAKAQELLGGRGFTPKKVDGKGWMIAKGGEKAENPDIADSFNTVLKMAKKRALVDAVLTATAASDIFTQDLEDITANLAAVTPAAPAAEVAATRPVARRSAAAPVEVEAQVMPATEEETQERPTAVQTVEKYLAAASILDAELDAYLRTLLHKGKPLLADDQDWTSLDDAALAPLVVGWERKHKSAILTERRRQQDAAVLADAPLN